MSRRPGGPSPAPPAGVPAALRVVTTADGLIGIAAGDRAWMMRERDAELLAADLAWAIEVVRAGRATAAAAGGGGG